MVRTINRLMLLFIDEGQCLLIDGKQCRKVLIFMIRIFSH
jgi:hypothetical protein